MSLLLLLAGLSLAAPDEDAETGESTDQPDLTEVAADASPSPKRWGGLIIPLIGASTTDGFGFGLGGQVFRRPRTGDEAYDLVITPSLYVNIRFNYTNNIVRVEYKAPSGTNWLGQVGYSGWASMAYAGIGGQDVILDGGGREIGNGYFGPYGFLSATRPIGESGWAGIAQVYSRGGWSEPAPGSLMSEERPFGIDRALYVDATIGFANERYDRWPVPQDGHIVEITATGGGTLGEEGGGPMAAGQIEAMIWRPLWPERLTLGGRLLVMKTLGERPFFEQDKALGRWRDELGSEQALAGYGRTRTRGDGVIAGIVELRPRLFTIRTRTVEFEGNLSLTAEMGWLYDGFDPGPPMPTVGVGVPLLWQRAVQLRPFLAWGWRRQDPAASRRPGMQVGISVLDAL